jgi:hypothetical protein
MDKTTSAIMAMLCLTGATTAAAEASELTTVAQNGGLRLGEARIVPEILQLFARVDANLDGQLGWADYRETVRQLPS